MQFAYCPHDIPVYTNYRIKDDYMNYMHIIHFHHDYWILSPFTDMDIRAERFMPWRK